MGTITGVCCGLMIRTSVNLSSYVLTDIQQWRSDAGAVHTITPAPMQRPAPVKTVPHNWLVTWQRPSPSVRPARQRSGGSRPSLRSSVRSSFRSSSHSSSLSSFRPAAPDRRIVPPPLPTTPPTPIVRAPWSSASLPALPSSSSISDVQGPAYSADQAADNAFPPFGKTVYPVSRVPNWGAMHGAAQWGRDYAEMTEEDFVPVPSYNLGKLSQPFKSYVANKDEAEVTRKLFYSTKFFAPYDLDGSEYTGIHPGVDLKLAEGTPLGAIAGGRVHAVRESHALGTHVIIEHRIPGAGTFYSVYGHLGSVSVREGQDVRPGKMIGTVGMTGNTSGAHLHLQVDRGNGEASHTPYLPGSVPSKAETEKWTVHPMHFIEKYSRGA